MVLKEFRIRPENTDNHTAREMEIQNRCIFGFYERLFRKHKIHVGDFWGIMVRPDKEIHKNNPVCCGNVLDVYIDYDINDFFSLNDKDKKEQSLKLLMAALKIAEDTYNIPDEIFAAPANVIKESGYNNFWVWQSKKRGNREARVEIQHEINDITMRFVVTDKNGKLTVTLDRPLSDSGVSDYDLCGIFGNIIDNALEVVRNTENKEIDLYIGSQHNMLYISCENEYFGELKKSGGILRSTKEDTLHHGIGLSRVRDIARDNGGDVHITAENGKFTIEILLNSNTK